MQENAQRLTELPDVFQTLLNRLEDFFSQLSSVEPEEELSTEEEFELDSIPESLAIDDFSNVYPDDPHSEDTVNIYWEQANRLARFIKSQVSSYPCETFAILRIIDEAFQRNANSNSKEDCREAARYKIRLLKAAINKVCEASEDANWQESLLGIKYYRISRTFLQKKAIDPDASLEIKPDDKQRFKKDQLGLGVCVVTGSSFATNIPGRLAETKDDDGKLKTLPILDATYVGRTEDGGWVMAVADGCGGHGNPDEDIDIGRAAYFAAKGSCQLMTPYPDAESLYKGLPVIKKELIQRLPVKVRAHRDLNLKAQEHARTTLGCVRIFPTEGGKFDVVGMNIGDSMLIAYNAETKQFQTLAPGRQRIQIDKSLSPCSLPDFFCKDEDSHHTFKVNLPEGSVVFGLTDGVSDYLPTTERDIKGENKRPGLEKGWVKYVDTDIDFDALTRDPSFEWPEEINVNSLTQALFDCSIRNTELARKNSSDDVSMRVGDDVHIVGIELTNTLDFKGHLKYLSAYLEQELGTLPESLSDDLNSLSNIIANGRTFSEALKLVKAVRDLLEGAAVDLFKTGAVINQETITKSRDAIDKYENALDKLADEDRRDDDDLPNSLINVLEQISDSLEPTQLPSHIKKQIANLAIENADESLTKPFKAFRIALEKRFKESSLGPFCSEKDLKLDDQKIALLDDFSYINLITQKLIDALTPFLNEPGQAISTQDASSVANEVNYQTIRDARNALMEFSDFLLTLSPGDKLFIAGVAFIGALAGIVGGFFAGLSIADHVVSSGGEQLISVFDQVIKALSSFDLGTLFETIGNAGTEAIAFTASGAAAGAVLVGASGFYCGYRGLFSPARSAARDLANAAEEVIAEKEKALTPEKALTL